MHTACRRFFAHIVIVWLLLHCFDVESTMGKGKWCSSNTTNTRILFFLSSSFTHNLPLICVLYRKSNDELLQCALREIYTLLHKHANYTCHQRPVHFIALFLQCAVSVRFTQHKLSFVLLLCDALNDCFCALFLWYFVSSFLFCKIFTRFHKLAVAFAGVILILRLFNLSVASSSIHAIVFMHILFVTEAHWQIKWPVNLNDLWNMHTQRTRTLSPYI